MERAGVHDLRFKLMHCVLIVNVAQMRYNLMYDIVLLCGVYALAIDNVCVCVCVDV